MSWLLLVAQLAAPVLVNPLSVFTPADMPAYINMAGRDRFVFTRTTVRDDGTVQNCTAERSSGDKKLDAFTCSLMVKRAKFQPAKWIDGTPAYSVRRKGMNWVIGQPSKKELEEAYPADVQVSGDLPGKVKKRTKVLVLIAVDMDGRVVGCDEEPLDDDRLRLPDLIPTACQKMMDGFRAVPAKDSAGQSVRSVQNATVLFVSK
jgi:hypothetical protein